MKLCSNMLRAAVGVAMLFAFAYAAAQTDADLAARFKPYIKSSLGPHNPNLPDSPPFNRVEPWIPITWQDFVANSDLQNGDTVLVPAGTWDQGYTYLETKGADLTNIPTPSNLQLHYHLPNDTASAPSPSPAAWQSVFNGDGVYAHVQRLGFPPAGPDNRLINIDYTILWTNNVGIDQHLGDLTFLVVLYDPKSDRIVRLTYPAHGCILQIYQTVPDPKPATAASVVPPSHMLGSALLQGQDKNSASREVPAVQVNIPQVDEDDETDGNCSHWGAFLSSELHIFLVQDPQTGRYDHPAIYAEFGSHESFPNAAKGSLTGAGNHNGLGPSWLPSAITILPAFSVPNYQDPNTAFIHYNGKVGTDGASVALHETWCWAPSLLNPGLYPCAYVNPHPNASVGVPAWPAITDGFADMNPYKPWRQLQWPQVVDSNDTGDAYAVPQRVQGNGTQESPFGGLDVALTFTPKGWNVHLAPGIYPTRKLDRPITLEATGATVTLTGITDLTGTTN